MSENTENIEMSAADEADLQLLLDNPPPAKRTLLETWRLLLTNMETSRDQKVSPGLANRIVSTWPKLAFQDTVRYHEIYHELLMELREILHTEISVDPDALKNVEDDAVDNRSHYRNLLLCWNVAVMRWEHEWDAASPESHIRLAAIGDASQFFIGQQGIVAHLDQIGFVFDEADQMALAEELNQIKAAL